MKTCIKCHLEKPIDLFSKRGNGTRNICKRCHTDQKNAWAHANKEKVREAQQRHFALRGRKRSLVKRPRKSPTRPRVYKPDPEGKRAYYLKNRERLIQAAKAYRIANADKVSANQRAWREANAARKKANDQIWRKNNPLKVNFYSFARMLRKRRAMPPWLSTEQKNDMIAIYERARNISRETGIPHEVDHIYPIRGKNCCGLHVPWNLRVVTKVENRSKGARLVHVPHIIGLFVEPKGLADALAIYS